LEKLVELGQYDDFRSAIQAFALFGFIKKLAFHGLYFKG
jgi:hypothetical protein